MKTSVAIEEKPKRKYKSKEEAEKTEKKLLRDK